MVKQSAVLIVTKLSLPALYFHAIEVAEFKVFCVY